MTEPTQKALDYAARKAGFDSWAEASVIAPYHADLSIAAHAITLDELWVIKPPKTRGELFADEMCKRVGMLDANKISYNGFIYNVAQMIDEGWEPKDA